MSRQNLPQTPLATSTFAEHLRMWGPNAPSQRIPSLAAANAYCTQLAKSHYENFPVVSWMLPPKLHQHFQNVYAFCRWADDLADEIETASQSLALLLWWKELLHDCYSGKATHPVFIALQKTISQFDIPAKPFEDLISAFEQDQHLQKYETFEQLQNYCQRSANPVGRIVLFLCERSNEANIALSDSICTGLQLANFWQDIARDADIGRCYLPREDCEQFNYTEEDYHSRLTNKAFIQLMQFEVQRARNFLQKGLPLVRQMPGRLQIDIDLFAQGGLKILERIERINYNVWQQRPKVTKWDGCKLITKSMFRFGWNRLGINSLRNR